MVELPSAWWPVTEPPRTGKFNERRYPEQFPVLKSIDILNSFFP